MTTARCQRLFASPLIRNPSVPALTPARHRSTFGKTYPRLSTISVDIRPLPIKTDAVSIGYACAYFLSTTDFRIKRSYFLRISIYPDELPIPFTPAKGIMIVNRKDKIGFLEESSTKSSTVSKKTSIELPLRDGGTCYAASLCLADLDLKKTTVGSSGFPPFMVGWGFCARHPGKRPAFYVRTGPQRPLCSG